MTHTKSNSQIKTAAAIPVTDAPKMENASFIVKVIDKYGLPLFFCVVFMYLYYQQDARMDSYLTEDRAKMLEVINNNTNAFKELSEQIKTLQPLPDDNDTPQPLGKRRRP